MKIRDYLKEHILLTDGAMGTYFDEQTGGEFVCSEEANLFQPDMIAGIHQSYIERRSYGAIHFLPTGKHTGRL